MGWYLKPSAKILYITLIFIVFSKVIYTFDSFMSKEERNELKEESRDMFYHAYRAYMENAYPADELMPLSCQGRYRGLQPSRGDMDDILGNFSLTLIDTLDTLVILGDFAEFEHGLKLIIRDVSFDTDVVVSVFETNIRILGGLLSNHILAEYLQEKTGILQWYNGELLDMAKDLGYRLLPAFNTTTGIPYSKVNLKYGIKPTRLSVHRETCTACAGTMILEMAALSRLTGEPIFEEKAHRAMDELWKMRHRSSDLMGTVLNVHSGDWVRRDSGVGAGIDSYYEYCLKAYILLGDERYLNRFNRHYNAVMKYVSQGPMLLDVHMHRPHTNSRNFMDALLAFWPGLQVLKGDIKPAVETHEMLYQVMQRHTFIPEAFTTDFQVHWGQHPLRPEFLESTYFLHRATNDPYYLEVGKNALKSLQKFARVPCGYAAVNDVRTGKHEDRMDSFVLAETFKYLYLLFADDNDLILDLNDFIFTTEAHLLPLTLAKPVNVSNLEVDVDDNDDTNFSKSCPSTLHLMPESLRKPLRNLVDGICPKKNIHRRLTASEFQAANPQHLSIIKDMGINILVLNDGRIQFLHHFSSARSISDAEEGMLFMQEMLQVSRAQSDQLDTSPQGVYFKTKDNIDILLRGGPSHFGPELRGKQRVMGRVTLAQPFRVCESLNESIQVKGNIVIMERGDCMFIDKARRIQEAGAIAGIVVDNIAGSSASNSPFFAMSGDGQNDVNIPIIFLFSEEAVKLINSLQDDKELIVTVGDYASFASETQLEVNKNIEKAAKIIEEISTFRTPTHTKISIGDFSATYRMNIIQIQYNKVNENKINVHDVTPPDPKWQLTREYILDMLFDDKENLFYMTPKMLTFFYKEFNTAKSLLSDDAELKLSWLLSELQRQLSKNPDLPQKRQALSSSSNQPPVETEGGTNIIKQIALLSEKVDAVLQEAIAKMEFRKEKFINGNDDDIVMPQEILNKITTDQNIKEVVEKLENRMYTINEKVISNNDDSTMSADNYQDDIVLEKQKTKDEL